MEFEFARNKQVSKQGVIQLYWALQKPKAKVKRVDKNKLFSMQSVKGKWDEYIFNQWEAQPW